MPPYIFTGRIIIFCWAFFLYSAVFQYGYDDIKFCFQYHLKAGDLIYGLLHRPVDAQNVLAFTVMHGKDFLNLFPFRIENMGNGGLFQRDGLENGRSRTAFIDVAAFDFRHAYMQ